MAVLGPGAYVFLMGNRALRGKPVQYAHHPVTISTGAENWPEHHQGNKGITAEIGQEPPRACTVFFTERKKSQVSKRFIEALKCSLHRHRGPGSLSSGFELLPEAKGLRREEPRAVIGGKGCKRHGAFQGKAHRSGAFKRKRAIFFFPGGHTAAGRKLHAVFTALENGTLYFHTRLSFTGL